MNELEVKKSLKEFFCNNLGIEADALEYDTPLFSDGIGLDSIDSLEIIAFVDSTYGVSMTGVGKEPFYNIDSIAAYIVSHS
ncbi:MAG: acyl carrier protein [Clostridiales bacterium]|nr:acyl carrier protein [Clostridiales bacterium]